jgi:hypothetical protein
MSAFDSAMLMIEDLTKQVVELEQQVWDLQLALWHERKDPKDGICTVYQKANVRSVQLQMKRICTLKKC